jgi:formate hydrogenlyase subunit 3/multisubunit Na+/H+ antiporter MnhD subunit
MLSGFVGEFIILSSTFAGVSRPWAVAATVAVILGATYMLWLVQRLFYGPESALAASKPASDLRFGELAILTPLVILMLVMGLAPNLWLNTIRTGVHPPPEPSPVTQTSVILSGGHAGASIERPAALKGHGFSRAVAATKDSRALAPEGPSRPATDSEVSVALIAPAHPEVQR